MLSSKEVQLVLALARIVLITLVSGALPPSPTQATRVAATDRRSIAILGVVDGVPAGRPVRSVGTRDGGRLDASARSSDAGAGLPSRIHELAAPAGGRAVLQRPSISPARSGVVSLALRGPPHSI
jgi:hypothetical protein